MNELNRTDLLGYLIGALEDDECERIRDQLRNSPDLNQDAERLTSHLALLASDGADHDPPLGLATRTCQSVFRQSERGVLGTVQLKEQRSELPLRRRFSLADLIAAAVIIVGAVVMILPAILSARSNAQLVACQNNLRQIGGALALYSELHSGSFPWIPPTGNRSAAGTALATLVHSGLLESESLICAGRSVSQPQLSKWKGMPAPKEFELAETMDDERRHEFFRAISPSFGNYLGVLHGSTYVGQHNQQRSTFAIASDTPSRTLQDLMSVNHGGKIQNVLWEDGHVQTMAGCRIDQDQIFLNSEGVIGAGVGDADSVIGSSDSSPQPRY